MQCSEYGGPKDQGQQQRREQMRDTMVPSKPNTSSSISSERAKMQWSKTQNFSQMCLNFPRINKLQPREPCHPNHASRNIPPKLLKRKSAYYLSANLIWHLAIQTEIYPNTQNYFCREQDLKIFNMMQFYDGHLRRF